MNHQTRRRSVAIAALAFVCPLVYPGRADAQRVSVDTEYGIVDDGDAALCTGGGAFGALIGKGAVSSPSTWEVAESLPEPVNSYVAAWRTGCTWGRQRPPLLALHVERFIVNGDYTGKEPWTPLKIVRTFQAISDGAKKAGGGYVSFDPNALAKTFKLKAATVNIYVIGDTATKGKHAAQAVVWGNTTAYVFAVTSNGSTNSLQLVWRAAAPFSLP